MIVVDTNVLVAGLLSPFGPCGQIVRMVSSEDVRLCLDARLLSEYAEVLRRPRFGFAPRTVDTLLAHLRDTALVVASRPLSAPLPDPDDEPFLEVALAGGADCLVTGNARHFPEPLRQGVRVLPPAEFLREYAASHGP